jgi:hypothetical protein
MKEIIICLILGPWIMIGIVYGQGISDFVGQQGKQLQILKDQIAELMAFKGLLEKGYAIAAQSTGNIMVFKQADLDMHAGHFDSLRIVKPIVSQDERVADIREILAGTRVAGTQIRVQSSNKQGPPSDLSYLGNGFADALERACSDDEDALGDLLKDGRLAMTDYERLNRLYEIWDRAENRFSVAVQVEESIKVMIQTGHL